MRIGVYRDYTINRCTFSYNDGSFSVYGDSTDFGSVLPNEYVELISSGNSLVELRMGTSYVGRFRTVRLVQNYSDRSMTLTPRSSAVKPRKYKDNFSVTNTGGKLLIVNLVDMNNYLAGVVESEGGGGRQPEYYKVQALMSRTYALKYRHKHAKEGFDLCDRVHCQAYHSMLRFTPAIDSAVRSTDGEVMTDEHGELVDAYFHANCGGQTCTASYVWNNDVPYLSTFRDTFCIYTRQAHWVKQVPKDEWLAFLVKRYGYPRPDSLNPEQPYLFQQEYRVPFYQSPAYGIPLRDLREKFDLRSTFFSCHPEGDYVVIEGRGFGHGVGLCQEGAMKMAEYGYDYRQIALFYFPGIHIINRYTRDFFGQHPVLPFTGYF